MTTEALRKTYLSALEAYDAAHRDWQALRGTVAPLEAGKPAPMPPPSLPAAAAKVSETWTACERAGNAYYGRSDRR